MSNSRVNILIRASVEMNFRLYRDERRTDKKKKKKYSCILITRVVYTLQARFTRGNTGAPGISSLNLPEQMRDINWPFRRNTLGVSTVYISHLSQPPASLFWLSAPTFTWCQRRSSQSPQKTDAAAQIAPSGGNYVTAVQHVKTQLPVAYL